MKSLNYWEEVNDKLKKETVWINVSNLYNSYQTRSS